jgi:hypothetical protein
VKNSGSEVYIRYCSHYSAGFSLQILEEGAHPERSTRIIRPDDSAGVRGVEKERAANSKQYIISNP